MPRQIDQIEPPAPSPLPIAVRVFPEPPKVKPGKRNRQSRNLPSAMFVVDTETRTDATQRLTFGSYRFIEDGKCLEEALFCADDLPPGDWKTLQQYCTTHVAASLGVGSKQLSVLTLRQFLDRFYWAAYKGRCLVVGFNLPFDLSRIAHDVSPARGRFAGGFSLGLWTYIDDADREHPNRFRPRIGVKQIDSKRALKGFTARNNPDTSDRIPEDSETGEPEIGYKFRGHFLDLRTLAFALTDRSYSLESACEAFDVEHGKQKVSRHGEITAEYIDYNRRDVQATAELAVKVLEEYEKHPIRLQATKAYSPASIGKAYLRAMGIEPILQRQKKFPKKYLGYAQSAFFGGRAGAHIRKVPVPVVYVDFLSMYPTVNSLMDLWSFVIAREIKVIEHCQNEILKFLQRLKPDDLFRPETWKQLPAFVKIIPNGDALPCRGRYSARSNDWQVAVNHLYANGDDPNDALWFSLPDVVASMLLNNGKIPQIVDAFRLEARGVLPQLQPTKLRGMVPVDPSNQDFFTKVIEERKRLSSRTDLSQKEKQRLDKALKVLANAASYGIYAEMNRQESDKAVKVKCHGIDSKTFSCRVTHPEVRGEYCFPPLASLITGAARLMLALLESRVTDLGGTYAMEDTDSMAIVATKDGGLIPCPGGSLRTRANQRAIKALSWTQVRAISEKIAALNPYARDAVPGSVLKIEEDNFDPKSKKQRQLFCLAISAKRYLLFVRNRKGVPVLLREDINNHSDRWSEHGLGHLLNPTDPEDEDRDWIAQAWLNLAQKSFGLSTKKIGFEIFPAIGRVTLSSPTVLRPFANFNEGKRYGDQIKPFNFLLTCHMAPFGHPIGVNAERFHLIGPYEQNSRKWLSLEWIDIYTGKHHRITTAGPHGTRNTARIKTYGEVLTEYEFHPESKCADANGNPCTKQTVGLLQRRHVRIEEIKYIGKESNLLEQVESGLVHSAQDVYSEYVDPRRDEWETKIRPVLRKTPLVRLVELTGLARSTLIELRAGRSKPHRRNREMLAKVFNA